MKTGDFVGRFEIKERLGEGGMGAVFRAIDTELHREVAFKALRPELAADPDIVERFRREAITQAGLIHPNIAQCYDLMRDSGRFFMIMEYVEGRALDDEIRQSGRYSVDQSAAIFHQILDAVAAAHAKGIVHRDLKPANVIVRPDKSIKVLDFGIARAMSDARMTRTGHLVGTPTYMAPEQIRNLDVDHRTDIYSLGILLYQLISGVLPFTSTSEFEVMRSQVDVVPEPPSKHGVLVAPGLERVILKAMSKKAEDRYQSVQEFKIALIEAQAGNLPPLYSDQPTLLTPLTVQEKVASGRMPWVVATLAIIVAAVVVIWLTMLKPAEVVPQQPVVIQPAPAPPAEVKPETPPVVETKPPVEAKRPDPVPPKTEPAARKNPPQVPKSKTETDELEEIRKALKGGTPQQ